MGSNTINVRFSIGFRTFIYKAEHTGPLSAHFRGETNFRCSMEPSVPDTNSLEEEYIPIHKGIVFSTTLSMARFSLFGKKMTQEKLSQLKLKKTLECYSTKEIKRSLLYCSRDSVK